MSQPVRPTLIELPPELRGERIVLRPWRPEDAEHLFSAIDESREHLRPWMPWVGDHASVDDTRDYCARSAANWLLRSELPLGVFDLTTGKILGATGFHEPNWSIPSFEIGYWLHAKAIGQGYMTEAVRLLADFAFSTLQARRLEIYCDTDNEPSRKVAERAGFVLEGRLRNTRLDAHGEPGDSFVFSLVPTDWKRIRGDVNGIG